MRLFHRVPGQGIRYKKTGEVEGDQVIKVFISQIEVIIFDSGGDREPLEFVG